MFTCVHSVPPRACSACARILRNTQQSESTQESRVPLNGDRILRKQQLYGPSFLLPLFCYHHFLLLFPLLSPLLLLLHSRFIQFYPHLLEPFDRSFHLEHLLLLSRCMCVFAYMVGIVTGIIYGLHIVLLSFTVRRCILSTFSFVPDSAAPPPTPAPLSPAPPPPPPCVARAGIGGINGS
jgi:hypothetical protein